MRRRFCLSPWVRSCWAKGHDPTWRGLHCGNCGAWLGKPTPPSSPKLGGPCDALRAELAALFREMAKDDERSWNESLDWAADRLEAGGGALESPTPAKPGNSDKPGDHDR